MLTTRPPKPLVVVVVVVVAAAAAAAVMVVVVVVVMAVEVKVVFLVHCMKAYRGSSSIAPLIYNLGTRWVNSNNCLWLCKNYWYIVLLLMYCVLNKAFYYKPFQIQGKQ
jgi:hypothetical protein